MCIRSDKTFVVCDNQAKVQSTRVFKAGSVCNPQEAPAHKPSDLTAVTKSKKERQPKPIFVEWWIKYVCPIKMILDVLFMCSNYNGWRMCTRNWTSFDIFYNATTTATDPDYLVLNKEVMYTVVGMLTMQMIDNLELLVILYYRQRFSGAWKIVGAHHFFVNVLFALLGLSGKGMLLVHGVQCMSHIFFVPMSVFRRWNKWENPWKVWAIAGFVAGGLSGMGYQYILFLLRMWSDPIGQETLGWVRFALYACIDLLLLHYYMQISRIFRILNRKGLIPTISFSASAIKED